WPLRYLTGLKLWRHIDGRVTLQEPVPDLVMRARAGGKRRERVNLWTEVKYDADGMARVLRVWIVGKARGRGGADDDMRSTCRGLGWAYSTFRRRRTQALQIIADGLNADRETVF